MNRTINILSTSRTALILLLATLLNATTAQGVWATNITTHITYAGLTASDVTFTLSGNGTSFELKNGDTKSVGVIPFPIANFTITCSSDLAISSVSYSGTYEDSETTGKYPSFSSNGNNGCSFTWGEFNGALTLNINVSYSFTGYTVHFEPNENDGGIGTMSDQAIATGVATALSPCTFTHSFGKPFLAWSTSADGSGTAYADQQSVTDLAATGQTVTLYALWGDGFFVHYDANGGTGTMSNQFITAPGNGYLKANAFTRTGYVFTGWNTASDGSGTAYADGKNVYNLLGRGQTLTLYAQWEAYYTVHFNANGGSGTMSDQTIGVGQAQALTANTFTRTGYYFAGWNTQTNGTGTTYNDGQSVTDLAAANETFNLYAQWKEPVTADYVDASGDAHTLTDCKEITSGHMPTSLAGNYIVSESVTYTGKVALSGNTTIILANGKTMSIGTEAAPLGGDYALYASGTNSLTIYGQSLDAATAGRLEVYSTWGAAVRLYEGSYAQHSGNVVVNRSGGSNNNYAINAGGSVTIDGGKLDASITSEGSFAIDARGNISISGGSVTANATGADSYGMRAKGNITLSWTRATDRITASGYQSTNGTVNIKSGQTLYAGATAYSGDNVSLPSGTVTLRPYSSDDFSVNDAGTEYTIKSATGWNVFCDLLADNTMGYFSGKTVQLDADITVTRMAGSDGHAFTGTFDGGGHTLTVNYANTDNNTRTAPFSYVDGATIQNLIVGGTISGDHYRAAGIIGETVNTTSHITNCVSSVDISSGRYTGGFSIGGNVEIEGCVFNGKIKGTTYSGGFIGYSYSAQEIKNSLFAPQDGSSISGGTFYYKGGGDVAPVNSYYTQALGTAQGKACHSVTAGDNVTIGAIALTGTPTQYTVSGITAYSGGGLQRGQTLYYGSGDQLSLTLTTSAQCDQPGYQYGYTASAGTLSGTTLTMPDQDVTISVALAPIDWATVNQGDSAEDPYMIYNKDQLLLLAHRVNGTNGETFNTYEGKYFKLGADITFSHPDNEGDDYAENYEAIGGYYNSTDRYFRGNFDGDGHTVSGIRIRKTGSGGYANYYQGLFGRIESGAVIHDVHLTDARITGFNLVGGIIGLNIGTVSGCTVTDSHITATGGYGTICGGNASIGTLTNNYYHGCTVNSTAATSGVGCDGSDITANNGALPAYRLDLGANITTPPGTFAGQTVWLDTPPVSPRLAPENGFTLAGNHYFASGYVFTPGSTLASGAAQGYTPRATLGGQLLDLYTPTGDADPLAGKAIARLTITADCDGKTLKAAIRSDGQQHEVSYITADGTTGEANAIALDGTETSLAAGTYFAGLENVNFDHTLNLTGDVTLILKDGCTMNVGTSGSEVNGRGFGNENYNIDIYAQSLGTGALNVYTGNGNNGIVAKAVTINGGNVTIDANGNWAIGIYAANEDITINGGNVSVTAPGTNAWAIYANRNLTINGGTVEASGTADGIRIDNGTIAINGGTVNASGSYGISANYGDGTITLGWNKPTDRITASSYSGTVAVADGKKLHNGSDYLGGTLGDPATALNGKTLRPAATATYTTADGTAATADAILLDASDNSLPAGNYLATGTLNYTHGITLAGNVTLILADNCHMNVGTSGERISGCGIEPDDNFEIDELPTLTITSESLGEDMGHLSVYTTGNARQCITTGTIDINGGNITADTDGRTASPFSAFGDLTINGGTVTATTAGTDAHALLAYGNFNYNGGNVTATAPNGNAICAYSGNYTFSWRTPADRITIGATGLYAPDGGTATFARLFTDGSGHIYTGTLTASELSGFAAETTLQPCLALAITYNSGSDCVWTTFVAETDCTVPEGLTAYTVGQVTASEAVAVPVDYLPKGVPVLLCRTDAATTSYAAVPCTVSETFNGGNLLSVATEPTAVADGSAYVLYGDEFVLAAGGTLPAGVVYLPVGSGASSARRLVISLGTTAIADAPIARQTPAGQAPSSAGWYAVDGRRLDGLPTAKGLYIHGGKKVIVK